MVSGLEIETRLCFPIDGIRPITLATLWEHAWDAGLVGQATLPREFAGPQYTLEGPEGFEFSRSRLATWRFDQLLIRSAIVPPWISRPELLDLPELRGAFTFNQRWTLIQSEQWPKNIEILGGSLDGVAYRQDDTLGRIVDISQNPGRLVPGPGMWIGATCHMWFGTWPVKNWGLHDLASAAGRAEKMTHVTYVALCEPGASGPTADEVGLFSAFRALSGLDSIERRRTELLAQLVD